MPEVRLITLDPGHFHAALVQKEMYAGVQPQVHVYAPLGPDLLAHLTRIAGFNSRPQQPTAWELEVHAGPGFLDRLLRERPGNVVVLSGRNRRKVQYLEAAVGAGLNVLADKPWIIRAEDLPRLDAVLRAANEKGLIALDIMTERYEITSILQREMVQDRAIFGEAVPGTAAEPGVVMESMHYLLKTVAGVPLRRPAWFFDVHEQGEGLTDVGTHLVDLVMWILFPGQGIDHRGEVQVVSAKRWPTVLSRSDYQRVTGDPDFPSSLAGAVEGDRFDYFCNTRVGYAVRGIQVRLDVLWDFESAGGGDTHFAVFRGTRARVEVRQGKEQNYRPELYVVPESDPAGVRAAVERKVAALQARYPGVAVVESGGGLAVTIPDVYRVGHEAHFGEVARQFLEYLREPRLLPAWERPNMLAKYHVTTAGVGLARANPQGGG
jgi:predicted dehydrogenase